VGEIGGILRAGLSLVSRARWHIIKNDELIKIIVKEWTMSKPFMNNFPGIVLESLTRRELEILQLLTENLSNNEIAEKLTLAPSSVKWFVKQIFAKLGVNSRQQAANRARELGLLNPDTPKLHPAHNLPISMTPFIGRDVQVEQVSRMITELDYRLVTLTGAGGVGKTRLALKVAEGLIGKFRDGVWLVEMASLNDGKLVDQTIASIFSLGGDSERSPQNRLLEYLRNKNLLLIIDDCEHLIEDCARLIDTLLRLCPNLQFLVTSRESLGLEGEIPFSVPSMSFPDPLRLPSVEHLNQYEAIRLFLDRARLISPNFTITDENSRGIARICKRLDGIPLAIELAAARVKILDIEQIADHLEESFRLLAGGFRTALPRHQTMRASINWSYQLLTESEHILLQRFSVFSGGWSLEACEAICSAPPLSRDNVIDLLMHLVNKSLVVVEQQDHATIRYYLLDAIWEFAHEKIIEAGEEQTLRNHHLSYFSKLAEEAEPHICGQQQIKWLDQLSTELPNLRFALDWGMKTNVTTGLKLASALKWFWQIRGYWSEGLNWINKGLAIVAEHERFFTAEELTNAQLQNKITKASAFAAAGFLNRANFKYHKTISLLKESLALYGENNLSERSGVAFTLIELAKCSAASGEHLQAETYARESLALYKEIGEQFGISECLNVLGLNETNPSGAKKMFLDALAIKREIGDINGMAYTLQMLAEITVNETEFEQASIWLEESLDYYSQVGNKKAIASSQRSSAWIAWVKADYNQAILEIDEAIQISKEFDERNLYSNNLLMRSDINLSKGCFEEAIGDITTAFKVGKEVDDKSVLALTQIRQGRMFWINKQYDQAVQVLNEALQLGRGSGNKYTTAFALYYLGQLANERNDIDFAAACHKQSMQTFYETNFIYWDYIAYGLEGLARTAYLENQFENSALLFGASNRLFRFLGNTLSPVEQRRRENEVDTIKEALGDEGFQTMWHKGYSSSTEEIIAYASNVIKS
jgi:predicted ATPase/DNA-binding CsgD family transcriptional regulator